MLDLPQKAVQHSAAFSKSKKEFLLIEDKWCALDKEIKDIEVTRDNAAILVDTGEGGDSLFTFSLRRKRQPRQC